MNGPIAYIVGFLEQFVHHRHVALAHFQNVAVCGGHGHVHAGREQNARAPGVGRQPDASRRSHRRNPANLSESSRSGDVGLGDVHSPVEKQVLEVKSGGMAITLAELCPEIQATVIELPSVTPITEVIVKESEVAHRVTVASQDVVAGPITGTYDVAVMRSFIQALPMEQARQAINNVGEVIEPNGMIYIIGAMLDNTRLTPHETVLSNLTSLNSYEDAQAYTEQEHEDWLAEAGFTDFTRVVLPNSHSIMTGRKQA